MTEGTEETITDPEEVLAKRSRRGVPRKPIQFLLLSQISLLI